MLEDLFYLSIRLNIVFVAVAQLQDLGDIEIQIAEFEKRWHEGFMLGYPSCNEETMEYAED